MNKLHGIGSWERFSPPSSYFCRRSVRPNCLSPNNVPLFSEPTLRGSSLPLPCSLARKSTFQHVRVERRRNSVSLGGERSRDQTKTAQVESFKREKMRLASTAPSSPRRLQSLRLTILPKPLSGIKKQRHRLNTGCKSAKKRKYLFFATKPPKNPQRR